MTPIQNPLIPIDGLFFGQGLNAKASQKGGVKSDFDLLLATFDLNNSKSKNNVSGNAMDILGVTDFSAFSEMSEFSPMSGGSQVGGMIDMYNTLMAQMIQPASQAPAGYGFSPEFASTFGMKGPLIDYINAITAQLKLSKEQNQAFQQIAVNNKDATQSEEWVQKIAGELKEAGIA